MGDPICANCGKSVLECQGFCTRKVLRDKISFILHEEIHNIARGVTLVDDLLRGILSLPLEGYEVLEYCKLGGNFIETMCATNCNKCEYLRCDNNYYYCLVDGKITRPATLRDLDEGKEIRVIKK